jgi:hypothetical protein
VGVWRYLDCDAFDFGMHGVLFQKEEMVLKGQQMTELP